MTDKNKELMVLAKIADLLDESGLDITVKVGVLEVLKHSLIQAAILSGGNQ